MQYELFYLVGERNEATLDAIRSEVGQILTDEKATLLDPEILEKRKMAYEIKHQKRGTYVTRRFELPEIDFWADEANGEKEFGIEAITKKLNLSTTVLRFLIVKTSDLPELGAKEKRQLQEQAAKTSGRGDARPVKTERRPAPMQRRDSSVARPAVTPAPVAEVKPIAKEEAVKEEVKAEEVPAEKEVSKAKTVKKDNQDIDKQLEELLNI